jgi:[lysine-biosynthesis-protein LysW]--L-2-aminoadipate ligase
MVDSKDLSLDVTAGKKMLNEDVVLQRCVGHFRNVHLTSALEASGHKVVNSSSCAWICGDKLLGTIALVRSSVPTPRTMLAFTEESALKTLDDLGYPAVIKPVVGSWGRLSALLKDRDAAVAVLEDREEMFPMYQVYYLQEFVKRPPRDIRSFVIGGRTVAAIYRVSESGDWRTNTARGGRAQACPVSRELDELSVKAAEATGGEILGVDLMESENGLVVHEVNGTTEFKNTVPVTGVDIPRLIVDYLVSIQKR